MRSTRDTWLQIYCSVPSQNLEYLVTASSQNIRLAQENNMTGSHKKQRYYETVHRTVSPKFVARFVRQIWSILSQVRATYIYIKIKKTSVWMSFLFGGNNRARTCDPLLVRQMLSQLSYAPVSDIDYITSCGECQEFILEKSSFILSISLFKYK